MVGKIHMKNEIHVDKFGTKRWYLNGMLHREDGPAEEWVNGTCCWWFNNKYLGEDITGFWVHWELLTHAQRCSLNLHFWLAKYST